MAQVTSVEQQPGEPVQRVAELLERALLGLAEQLGHLLVDDPLGRRGVGTCANLLAAQVQRAARSEPDRAQRRAEAILVDHAGGKVGGAGRSLVAPVEASPSTSSSAALPPRRIASESFR